LTTSAEDATRGSRASEQGTKRPRIAFFEYADVFEDFYPHYGVRQASFVLDWAATSSHAFLGLIQREVGDVCWYELSLRSKLAAPVTHRLGFEVRILRSSAAHRALWHAFYGPRSSWRWRGAYRPYATVASYLAPLSLQLARALRRDRPDVLFAQSYSSGRFDVLLAAGRALGVPLVAYHTGGAPDGYLGASIRRRTLKHADLLIASSAAERKLLVERFGASPTGVRVILTPIDTMAFEPVERTEACRRAGLDPSRRYLLFVGRLSDHEKRIGALVDAFARVSPADGDTELLVVGEGTDGSRLRERASTCPRVRFLGWADGPERLAALYGAAECLVLPSRREGFPTVVGEAMACGTPVLASRVGGVPELVVEGETGWLLEPGDDDALAERLDHILRHPEEAERMRPAARRAAEARVSPEVVGTQLRDAFASVIR
jgi:glycosyltransferase involved in cell wall biosynthesis